jgi:hypothetical protein
MIRHIARCEPVVQWLVLLRSRRAARSDQEPTRLSQPPPALWRLANVADRVERLLELIVPVAAESAYRATLELATYKIAWCGCSHRDTARRYDHGMNSPVVVTSPFIFTSRRCTLVPTFCPSGPVRTNSYSVRAGVVTEIPANRPYPCMGRRRSRTRQGRRSRESSHVPDRCDSRRRLVLLSRATVQRRCGEGRPAMSANTSRPRHSPCIRRRRGIAAPTGSVRGRTGRV